MDVALLSDIHSNVHALEATLRHLGRLEGSSTCSCGSEHMSAEQIWCLGDTVGYNAAPRDCLYLMRQHADVLLIGNHDWAAVTGDYHSFNPHAAAGIEHTLRELAPSDVEFLRTRSADEKVQVKSRDGASHAAFLCHGSPDDPLWEYVDERSGRRFLERTDLPPLVAFGHTHVPFVLRGDGGRLVLNVGSVGQPRDGDPRACFTTVNLETREVIFHRVTYDVEEAARANARAGLPKSLSERLIIGR